MTPSKPLTPGELAEKIKEIMVQHAHIWWSDDVLKNIAFVIGEAMIENCREEYTRRAEAKAEAYEDAAGIAHGVAEDELERARGYKGSMVFQSQSYIDGAVEVEDQIRARARSLTK